LLRLRRSLPKLLLALAATATALVVLLAAAASIGMSISLGAGLIICIAGLLLMAWSVRSLGKSKPTLVSTVLPMMVCFLFCGYTLAYLDIRSMSDIRAITADAFHSEEGEFRQSVEVVVARMDLQAKDAVSQASESVKEVMDDVGTTSHVYGLALHNNPDASNPTWDELVSFLANDDIDSHRYALETFNCGDFAQMLHNRAEKAGIRTAFVVVQLGPCEYWPSAGGHCLNAFETTDRGLVYIDCTGCSPEFGDCHDMSYDKVVQVSVGEEYVPELLFPPAGWDSWRCWSMGVVRGGILKGCVNRTGGVTYL
jgi:hypothetical protein